MKKVIQLILYVISVSLFSTCEKNDEFIVEKSPQIEFPFIGEAVVVQDTARFNFIKELYGKPSTLSASITNLNKSSGQVSVNGGDSRQPEIPFTFIWGDGKLSEGFFPQDHHYSDVSRNYIIRVIANYSESWKDTCEALVCFHPTEIKPISIPSMITVSIPSHQIQLLPGRLDYAPDDLTFFGDEYFSLMKRSDLEYILSIAAWIQFECVNRNVILIDGAFNQVLLRKPDVEFQGMASLWFTTPPSFCAFDLGIPGGIPYLGLFHESGHGFTLNTPANYCYGGKSDGPANAIYSESLACIFSIVVAREIINNYEYYGLSDEIVFDIFNEAKKDASSFRENYLEYVQSGRKFKSWNNSWSESDNTFNTFTTIAYLFWAHAEQMGLGYLLPAQRMMKLLQEFNPDFHQRYDPYNDSKTGETFRSTLLVTALSYAFNQDLRDKFRNLNFPIDDAIYEELWEMVEE